MWDSSSDIKKTAECGGDKLKDCGFELKQVRYVHFVQAIQLIYQKEGAKAFVKGIAPRMCINIPSTALSWGTYELIKGFLTPRNKE